MLEASGIFYLLNKSGEKGVNTEEETSFSLSPLPCWTCSHLNVTSEMHWPSCDPSGEIFRRRQSRKLKRNWILGDKIEPMN